jgi:hypothetical protein
MRTGGILSFTHSSMHIQVVKSFPRPTAPSRKVAAAELTPRLTRTSTITLIQGSVYPPACFCLRSAQRPNGRLGVLEERETKWRHARPARPGAGNVICSKRCCRYPRPSRPSKP